MNSALRMRQYQRQSIATATPDQLVAKLYELGIAASYRGDRQKARAVLVELMGSLNLDAGGDLADRLYAIYEFCIRESAVGDMTAIGDILSGLREAWQEGVLATRAAA